MLHATEVHWKVKMPFDKDNESPLFLDGRLLSSTGRRLTLKRRWLERYSLFALRRKKSTLWTWIRWCRSRGTLKDSSHNMYFLWAQEQTEGYHFPRVDKDLLNHHLNVTQLSTWIIIQLILPVKSSQRSKTKNGCAFRSSSLHRSVIIDWGVSFARAIKMMRRVVLQEDQRSSISELLSASPWILVAPDFGPIKNELGRFLDVIKLTCIIREASHSLTMILFAPFGSDGKGRRRSFLLPWQTNRISTEPTASSKRADDDSLCAWCAMIVRNEVHHHHPVLRRVDEIHCDRPTRLASDFQPSVSICQLNFAMKDFSWMISNRRSHCHCSERRAWDFSNHSLVLDRWENYS